MTIALYMDHHIPRAITIGLRLQGVDVLTAFDDGANQAEWYLVFFASFVPLR